MAAVLQQDLIFSGTILDNLTLGKNYDMKDIEEAIRIASADFIYEKPEGLDYKVHAKGTNLSGGQKQRILIARALLKNPSVLILDDASSALDYETDMKIRQALRSYNNMTKIIVAQRISSIKDADLILLIDEGKIIAKGTHEHLIETNEQYRTIYEHQLGGEVL
jgi:ATP-binding cassette subfamily B protein